MKSLTHVLKQLFTVGTILFFVLGTTIVFVQLISVITTNGVLAQEVNNLLLKPACMVASITGLIGFITSYMP